jgi:iron complex outermembrane receptor protein
MKEQIGRRGLVRPMLKLALLSACCAGAASGVAIAQEASDPLSEVVVRASRAVAGTKTDTKLVEIPQSISVVTAAEIADRTVVNFQDVFRYSAGVATELNGADSRGDFFSARGFPTEQYLDGLKRMPDFIYGARLEVFSLERAEVLRGPSAVLYGAGGAGGLLNAVSKTPRTAFGGEIGAQLGTDKRKQLQLDITGPLSDTVSGRFVGLVRDGELQWKGQPDDRVLVNPSLKWSPTEHTDVTLIGLYQKDNQGTQTYLPISKSIAANGAERLPDNFFAGEPDFNRADTEFWAATLLVNHRFNSVLSFSSRSRVYGMNTDYREVYGDYGDGFGAFYVSPFDDVGETLLQREFYVNREKSKGFNTDNSLAARFDTGPFQHTVLAGVDYFKFKQDKDEGFSCDGFAGQFGCFNGPSPPSLNIYDPQYGASFAWGYTNFLDYRSSQTGLYVQDQIRFADRVSIVLGARRDRATSKRNGVKEDPVVNWSYRAGIIAEVGYGFSPYVSYSESFLPVAGGDFYGNPFKPRTGRQYEGGVKWAPSSQALVTVSYFDIKESNYVTQDPNNIQNFIQTGQVGSQGFEVEGTLRIPGDIELMGSYSYTKAKVLTDTDPTRVGARIEGVPKHLASAWATKTFRVADEVTMRAGGGVRYVGSKIDSYQRFVTPSATLVDALIEAERKDWSLSLSASNIFNTRYYASCTSSSPPDGICVVGKDRTIQATLRRRF